MWISNDWNRVLIALLYAYPLSLWIVLFLSSLLLHRRNIISHLELNNRRGPWNVIWGLQICLIALFVVGAALSTRPYIWAIYHDGLIRETEASVVSYSLSETRVLMFLLTIDVVDLPCCTFLVLRSWSSAGP